jgi:NADH-quinone oxidoreductase subunit J
LFEFLDQAFIFEMTTKTIIFVVGFTAVLASLGVIFCASPIYSALYLIGNMMCLATLFLLYNAEFLAAVQIIVYAGAVMILFLFIIALLGGKKEESESSFQKLMALGFVATLFGELLMAVKVGQTKTLEGKFPDGSSDMVILSNFGSAKAIGLKLFSQHLVAFELASILLLVAAIGVIVLAKFPFRPLRRRTR